MNHSLVADAILEEMLERDWNIARVVIAAGKKKNPEYGITHLALHMYLTVDEPGLRLGRELINDLAMAFNVSKEFFENLENALIKLETGSVGKPAQ